MEIRWKQRCLRIYWLFRDIFFMRFVFGSIMMNAWKDWKGIKQACLMNMCANALRMQDHTNKMINVSLCISISQVPKDTYCFRWIFPIPIGVQLPLVCAIASSNKPQKGHACCKDRVTQEDPSFLSLILITNWSKFNWLNFF